MVGIVLRPVGWYKTDLTRPFVDAVNPSVMSQQFLHFTLFRIQIRCFKIKEWMRGYSPECLQQNNHVLLDSYFILSYQTFLFFQFGLFSCVCIVHERNVYPLPEPT